MFIKPSVLTGAKTEAGLGSWTIFSCFWRNTELLDRLIHGNVTLLLARSWRKYISLQLKDLLHWPLTKSLWLPWGSDVLPWSRFLSAPGIEHSRLHSIRSHWVTALHWEENQEVDVVLWTNQVRAGLPPQSEHGLFSILHTLQLWQSERWHHQVELHLQRNRRKINKPQQCFHFYSSKDLRMDMQKKCVL